MNSIVFAGSDAAAAAFFIVIILQFRCSRALLSLTHSLDIFHTP